MIGWLKSALSPRDKVGSPGEAPAQLAPAHADLIERGNRLLDQGRLHEAADAYRQAAALRPDDAVSRVNLGYALMELGRLDVARESLGEAVRLQPSNADALYMLGLIARSRGELALAIAQFTAALAAKPDFELVHGELCHALFQAGRLGEACDAARKGIALFPRAADLHCYLGNLLVAQSECAEALSAFRKALALQPDYAEAHSGMGLALRGIGQFAEAVDSCQRAIGVKPDWADAHFNLGLALKSQGLLEEAVRSYNKALTLNPSFAEAFNELGLALKEQGRLEAAAEHCRHALMLKPGYAEAYRNLGLIYQGQGKLDVATEYYLKAIAIEPGSALAHNNLACTLKDQGRLEEAIDRFRQALALQPGSVEIHNNLGSTLQLQGCLDEAIGFFRKALALDPDCIEARGNLLFVLSYHTGQDAAAYLDEARRYGRTLSARASPFGQWKTDGDGAEPQPLRVGLVSGDLRNHPVGYFLESLLAHLARERIELLAYPTLSLEDDLTARIKPRFAAWKPLTGLKDAAAASLIHEDGIHVLVDLSGHTAHNRLPMFAWKPAPVQATWLGYFASTGVAEIDYLLADPVSVPSAERNRFTERIWYLPDTRLCFTPPTEQVPVAPLPALRNGHITFGSFQSLTKLNEAVLAAWGDIFRALPSARLRLQSKQLNSQAARANLLQRLGRAGIPPARVMLHGQTPRSEYLSAHAEVDIILDTFPYPGGTTTCEALWMGVPTLTLAGDTLLERQGANMVGCAGLEGWAARSVREYVALAVRHAGDIEALARLREDMRGRALASPLFDARLFAARLEAALRGMWREKMFP